MKTFTVKEYDNGAVEIIYPDGSRSVRYNTNDVVEFDASGKVTLIFTDDGICVPRHARQMGLKFECLEHDWLSL